MKDVNTNQLVQIPEINETEIISALSNGALMELVNSKFSQLESMVFNMENPAEIEACRSISYAIARTKTALEKTVTNSVAEQKAALDRITSQKTSVVKRMDEIKRNVRAPLTALEEAEKAKQEAFKANMNVFLELKNQIGLENFGSENLKNRLNEIKSIEITAEAFSEEFIPEAKLAKYEAIEAITEAIKGAEEIERVQKEQAAKQEADRIEREEQIRKAAAEQAERQADERIRQAEERARVAEERAIAEQNAKQEAQNRDKQARNEVMVLAANFLHEKIAETGMLEYEQAEELAKILVKSIYSEKLSFLTLNYK